jgi:hypothetical protein
MAQSFNDGNRHLGLPSPSNKIFFCRQGSLTGAVGEVLVDLDQSAGPLMEDNFSEWIGSQYLPRRTRVILS